MTLSLIAQKDNLGVVDTLTGEMKFRLTTARQQEIENFVKTLPDNQKSELLTKSNFLNRVLGGLEKALKDYVKQKPDLEFDDNGVAMWQDFRVKKILTARFSERKLLEEGNEEEKALWDKLKTKFTTSTESIRI